MAVVFFHQIRPLRRERGFGNAFAGFRNYDAKIECFQHCGCHTNRVRIFRLFARKIEKSVGLCLFYSHVALNYWSELLFQ